MEDPEEIEPSEKKATMEGYHNFRKDELSIQIEEKKDEKQTFYVKSEIFFDKVEKAIRSALKQFKSKLKKPSSKKDTKGRHQDISKKLYNQQRRLEKKIKKIENSLQKTSDLASQIKEDTDKIEIDVEWVVMLTERHMLMIEDVETYMKDNLGSDWNQIKHKWQEYKDAEISMSDFINYSLGRLSKKFLGIFV